MKIIIDQEIPLSLNIENLIKKFSVKISTIGEDLAGTNFLHKLSILSRNLSNFPLILQIALFRTGCLKKQAANHI